MSAQQELLLDTFLIEGTSYWLGLTDLAHEGFRLNYPLEIIYDIVNFAGTYRWQESHKVAEYVNWAPGQPEGATAQNCVWKAYHPTHPGWHDAPCSWSSHDGFGQMHALCEAAKESIF